jgi:hypothetical protein
MSEPIPHPLELRMRIKGAAEWMVRCTELHIEENRRNGQTARAIRIKSGRSLRSVAKRMGVSAVFLSDLERGNLFWNDEHATKWATIMSSGTA